jgi:aminopeptidase S
LRLSKSVLFTSGARVTVLAAVLSGCGASTVGDPKPIAGTTMTPRVGAGPLEQQLVGEVTDAGAIKHLQQLQTIADANGGNRAAGTSGYDASVNYVVGVLRADGFDVSVPTYQASDHDSSDCGATSHDVVAQTKTGDASRVVMIGAHLDSVPDGAGIVDDGSGVATLLELANRLGPSPALRNTVRFAFFGNEETGGQGSSGYVQGLSDADRSKILLYLNVDMVASPNGGFFAQGGWVTSCVGPARPARGSSRNNLPTSSPTPG